MKSFSHVLAAALLCAACSSSDKTDTPPPSTDTQFGKIEQDYVVYFLSRNPVVATYLGGSALDSSLAKIDGRLRDHSAAAIAEEDGKLAEFKRQIQALPREKLSPARQTDRDVALAQIEFQLHLHQVRKYQQRALDSYLDEPFRGVDWQLQGMSEAGGGKYGTEAEWQRIIERLDAVGPYLGAAREQLRAGVANGNTPDWRMLRRNGINTAKADADYFDKELPKIADERLGGPQREALLDGVRKASASASAAYRALHQFIAETFFDDATKPEVDRSGLKPAFRDDHFAMGEAEYNWALQNNLRLTKTAAQLYDESWAVVQATQEEMIAVARTIGQERGLTLPADGMAAVRAVFDELSKNAPKSDDEMIGWYRDAGERLVKYARDTGLFDMPAEYKLEVTITPPPLQGSISGAAYYPAPPFKDSGVGRFYVTPTNNDPASLAENNRSSLAYLAAHEGFPGHDWHYKIMTQYRDQITRVRWLTPGAVEDSSSMWEDSAAAEGWGLYAEALMAEPQSSAPKGFYKSDERLYQLQGKLLRDVRVRVDTGIHIGRLTFDEAVDVFSQAVHFLPGACKGATDAAKVQSCAVSVSNMFRYSKWPTQAITYRLGKEAILELRSDAEKKLGTKFSAKAFHIQFMKQGTIPPGYFREQLLANLEAGK
ncbi:DUF885 domain-containing protein [Pendulispora albinea]|uniref:DUF885 domain-containing protein n=1 Tax=Pendulispora albinea TaxID=2741071 RepID=A0ABZ2M4R6_9BACT